MSSSERIGFHSVGTVWFSFPWLFWLLLKKRFQHGWQFCRVHDPSATGIILSFLHAKTGREQLVYFIVSYHIVLNLYFIKWIGLKSTRDFLHFKDIDSILWWLLCTFRNSTCHQLFNVTIARLNKTSFLPCQIREKKSWNFCADYVSPRRKQSDDKYRLWRRLLRDNCPAIYTTWRKVANKITPKLMGGL